ncbi:hypothetical protein CMV_010636 [Castanea mollissima]|uniref:Uncharacterized protein n=1 Tax=Castanea mollissima TaxID=60419 RepID=A0A8J4REW2_9ROSI|nr:hypothetical protein CMV_010636 [Castanea mollissima]
MIEKATKFYIGFRSANQKQLEDRDRLLQKTNPYPAEEISDSNHPQFAPGSSLKVLITSANLRIQVVDSIDLVHKFKENYQNSLCNAVCSYEHLIFPSVDNYTM